MISSEGKITIISAKIGVNSEALVMNKVKISKSLRREVGRELDDVQHCTLGRRRRGEDKQGHVFRRKVPQGRKQNQK